MFVKVAIQNDFESRSWIVMLSSEIEIIEQQRMHDSTALEQLLERKSQHKSRQQLGRFCALEGKVLSQASPGQGP